MGNHVAGKAIGLLAQTLWERRQPGETALELLDQACAGYRNCDAEFEAEDPNNPGHDHPEYCSYTDPHPKAGLGMLIVEAFSPNGVVDLPKYEAMLIGDDGSEGAAEREEVACDLWWAGPYAQFRKRYGFC